MARRWRKVTGTIVLVLIALILIGITFTIGWRPFIGPRTRALTDRTFESTPARLERGRYMVNAVYGCLGCHSEPDKNAPGVPAKRISLAREPCLVKARICRAN